MSYRWIARLGLFIADVLLLEAAFFGVYWWRFRTGMFANPVTFRAAELLVPSLIVALYWVLGLAWFGLYRFDPLQSRAVTARNSVKAAAVGILILFILTFDPNRPLPGSRIVLVAYGAAIFLIVGGNRVALLTVLREFRLRGWGALRTLLIGCESRAASVLRYLTTHPELGMKIHGALSAGSQRPVSVGGVPVIGPSSRLRSILDTGGYQVVLLALDERYERQLGRMLRILREGGARIFIPADQYPLLVGEVKPTQVHGHPLVEVRPALLSPVERIMKRLTDLAVALIVLAVTSPLWLILVLAIPLDSAGPIFYSQKRVGKGGRVFTLYKFRSMRRDAESETGAVLAQERDPRVTRVGRIIRAVRLDELPQLINILLGDMSVVGPRPERMEFVQQFVRDIPLYERRLNVKPGLTGWSQVHLRYDTRADQIPVKLKYDFFYIENMGLPLDVKIMFMTLFVMLRGEGL